MNPTDDMNPTDGDEYSYPALPLTLGSTAQWRSTTGRYVLTQVDANTLAVASEDDPTYDAVITRTGEFYDIQSTTSLGVFPGTATTWDELLTEFLGKDQ